MRAAGAVVFGKTNLPRWSGDAQAFKHNVKRDLEARRDRYCPEEETP